MYEWSLVTQCCAVLEIRDVNGVMRKERITRKLHLQANVTKKVIILHNPSYRL